MSPLGCISVILAISGVLAARWRATELSNVQLYFLVGICFLASILIRRYATMLSRSQKPPEFIPYAKELNDSLFELYKPLDTPSSMSVIFLHGLQSVDSIDPHLSTWKSGDGSCLWPQTWLIEKFPGARVLSVSYKAHEHRHEQGEFDIYNIGENLLSDILQVNIGQGPYCPVILVGHCFGGFVIKELCNRAYDSFTRASDLQKKGKLGMLLGNIRGIYYYGTPHRGSPLMDTKVHRPGSNLLEYFKLLSKDGARLNEKFEQLRKLYPKWRIHGLGESRSTESGTFHEIVGAPEASSRAGDSFNIVDADHIQICRPAKKTSRSFSGLVELLVSIAADVKEERARAQEEEAQAAERSRLQNLQRLPKQITGIEARVEEVKTKLVESRTLGLVGMGGCGKTTLAKAVFNKLVSGFEYTAFVREVKLLSGREADLKKEVWSQMRHFGKEMDANPKWSLLNQKSLLLVLDDVSTDRDLEVLLDIAEYLSPESRFLVTSRDRYLVKTLEGMYEVPLLDEGIANELFMRHAFPEKMAAPSELGSLVGAIVGKCDGLPLTLEIIGKYLYKRDDKQEWEQTLIALGRADSVTGVNEKLWEKLKLSFDGLQEEEKEIFLDVATFFCGNNNCTLGEAKAVWKVAYAPANERLLWRTLVDRSLVYDVEDSEIIQMHEQLLDLGRKIGANHNNMRRVWNEKEARDLLQTTSQRHDQEIVALRLHESRNAEAPLRIARRTLLGLTEMRYLEVDANATISGGQVDEVKSFLEKLVFVHLERVQLNFTSVFFDCTILNRLVILHLDGYKEDYLPESFSSMSALKILELGYCHKLHSLPKSFGELSALSKLKISNCKKMQNLPESFGQLSELIDLEFYECDELQSLPESFGQLSALSKLKLTHCTNLQSLPESFGQLSALSDLQLNYCERLESLPGSFGQLSALSNLRFCSCDNLRSLPESFGQLSALSDFQLKYCERLESLPGSFGQLSALSNLLFCSCENLQSLPESFGQLSALSDLRLEYCESLESLPESFGQLSALSDLQLEYCERLESLPGSFGQLSALSTLRFLYCKNLQSLPESFRQLSALSNLQFVSCKNLQSLPESFGQLSALSNLLFCSCENLQSLPESFGQLSALSDLRLESCESLESLPESFGQLSALSDLQLKYCERLESLPGSFGQLSALSNLRFSKCHNLQSLPESFGQLSALSDLQLNYCERLESLPGSFGQLSVLRHLSIKRAALRSVPDSIRSLPSLQVLELGCLPFVKEFPPWLGKEDAGLRKMSRKTFNVRDGNFALFEQSIVTETEFENITDKLYGRVLRMVLSSDFATHCDKCGMYPLEWPRYKSSASVTQFCHVLCPSCFQQSRSNAPEYTCEDSPVPVHCSVSCDGCDMKPLKGPRYKSSTIYNFDLCQDCFRRSGSNASEYICSEPSVLSAGDWTTDILDAILNLDADDQDSEIHWSSKRVQLRVLFFQERGIVKRLVGDLRGALDDLNKALEIVLSQTSSECDFLEDVRYACLKHGAYVKFLLGDIDEARCDAQEALSLGWSEYRSRGEIRFLYAYRELDDLGSLPVRFLDLEMR